MRTRIDRRELLIRVTGAATTALWPWHAAAQETKTRLILLGTGGGPRPRKASSAPAQVIVINGTPYVVDCGDGVVWLAWAAGLRTRVDTWGPPPLEKMTRLFFAMNAPDIKLRIADEGRVPLVPLVHVHELKRGGEVMRDENVTVTAALANHPPVVPAFSYRFDARDRSIVISGDTARSDNLVKLAHGADVLVHTAFYPPALDRLVARVPNARSLKQSILAGQTSAEDAGRVAQAAGVKTLVLSHLVPPDDPDVTDQMWIDAARMNFAGSVIVGKDLMEI